MKIWIFIPTPGAVTADLDLTNGDLRIAQSLSGRANPQTVTKYDDNRLALAGDIPKQPTRRIS